MKAPRVECIVPILRVRSLAESLDYYQRALGFSLDWRAPEGMASVSRDGHAIMLCEGGQGRPGTWVWIGVADAGAVHEECVARGARIRRPPANYAWAYELQVEDPDGHVLRFGSEPRTGEPFVGAEAPASDPGSTAADLVRRFYEARASGDRDTLRTLLHPHVAWHDPYPPPHGGDLRGAEVVFATVFDQAGELTGGSTRLWLESVQATARQAAAVVGWSSAFRGRSMQGRELAVFSIRDGRIVEAWFYPEDAEAASAFFS